ncbi:hypothetical protein SCMC78_69140 [Streptomyces sp. CMC78]|uniref:Uncharacterized protein n=2 Tax=Streptomyces TaxID=1883 RepID=A0AB33KRC4_9ACTN
MLSTLCPSRRGPAEGVGIVSSKELTRLMRRLIAATVTVLVAASFAVAAAVGVVALLDATPDQPNTPLISYDTGPAAP